MAQRPVIQQSSRDQPQPTQPPLQKATSLLYMTFRVRTSTSIKMVKQHEAIARLLDHCNAILRYSNWNDQEEDAHTTVLGFLLQYDT